MLLLCSAKKLLHCTYTWTSTLYQVNNTMLMIKRLERSMQLHSFKVCLIIRRWIIYQTWHIHTLAESHILPPQGVARVHLKAPFHELHTTSPLHTGLTTVGGPCTEPSSRIFPYWFENYHSDWRLPPGLYLIGRARFTWAGDSGFLLFPVS